MKERYQRRCPGRWASGKKAFAAALAAAVWFTALHASPALAAPATFSGPTNFGAGDGPFSVAVADLNGDGKPDLAVANFNSDDVSVLLGNGDGSFGAPQSFAAGDGPASVAASDLNGDTKPDLAVANFNSDDVSVPLNTSAEARPGTLRFDPASHTVDEDAGTATITVVRTGGSDGEVGVDYATSGGTATAGPDYAPTSGTLVFADGETTKTFEVPIRDDDTNEGAETVDLALSNPRGGASLDAQSTAEITITDDDAAAPPPAANQPPPPSANQPPPPAAANKRPDAKNDSYRAREDTKLVVRPSRGVLKNDRDPDGDRLRARTVKGPRHGKLALRADGSFVYTPKRDYAGPDSFSYSVSDGRGGVDRASVRIGVRGVPEPRPPGGGGGGGSSISG